MRATRGCNSVESDPRSGVSPGTVPVASPPTAQGLERRRSSPVVQVDLQEPPKLGGQLAIFGRPEESSVRHCLEDVQLRVDSTGTQFAVHSNGVGEKKITGSGLQERRGEGA